jgi:hypothetical protein
MIIATSRIHQRPLSLPRWTALCATAEAIGMAATATAARASQARVGGSQSVVRSRSRSRWSSPAGWWKASHWEGCRPQACRIGYRDWICAGGSSSRPPSPEEAGPLPPHLSS